MIPPLLALFAFPIVAIVLFARLKPVPAMISTIVSGYLLLPHGEGFNLPLLPTLDKHSIPVLVAAVAMASVLARSREPDPRFLEGWLPRSPLALGLIGLILCGTVGTALTNGDPIIFGSVVIPALRPYDAASFLLSAAIILLPFLLARRFLGHPDTHPTLLFLLMLAGLCYSLFAIYEARMSPQLNIRIYGYFQHIWVQHIRPGGFRPIIFLENGLLVSILFATAFLATLGLYRGRKGAPRWRYLIAAGWLLVTIVVTKSLGALMIAVLLTPVILLLTARQQLLMAAAVAGAVMIYPVLRGAHLVPVEPILTFAEKVHSDRAHSFRYRLYNEEILLEKAEERPLFGWGGWGRNAVYDEDGTNVSVTDGYWIIVIGQRGWVGYVGIFGLLSAGILGLAWQARRFQISPATAGLAVVLAGNMIDLIPNAGISVLTWMMAGALLGRLEHGLVRADAPGAVAAGPPRGELRYSRFGPHAAPGDEAGAPVMRASAAPHARDRADILHARPLTDGPPDASAEASSDARGARASRPEEARRVVHGRFPGGHGAR